MSKKCKQILESGKTCGAWALTEKEYCFSHDPESTEDKIEAVRRGGLAKQIRIEDELQAVEIASAKDVSNLLAVTIKEVREGKIPPQIANTIGFLSGHLLRAYEMAELDNKLEEIKSVIDDRTPKRKR